MLNYHYFLRVLPRARARTLLYLHLCKKKSMLLLFLCETTIAYLISPLFAHSNPTPCESNRTNSCIVMGKYQNSLALQNVQDPNHL